MASAKTKASTPRRSYHQFCGLARALDVLGERWTLLIVRNLLLGPRRYSDLLDELPGITTNLLAQRLKSLEHEGLIAKRKLGKPSGATVYGLSETGAALEPALMELARFGGRYLDQPRPDDRVDIGWALLSMKRRYIGNMQLRVALWAGERGFDIEVSPDRVRITEGDPAGAQVTLRGSVDTIFALLFLQRSPAALEASGHLQVEGSRRAFRELLRAFPPSKNPATLGARATLR